MKVKYIAVMMLSFLLIMCSHVISNAEEFVYNYTTENDEVGHITSGSYLLLYTSDYLQEHSNEILADYYLYPQNESGLYIVRDSTSNTYTLYSCNKTDIYIPGFYRSVSLSRPGSSNDWTRTVSNGYDLYPAFEGRVLTCTIPIFDSSDATFDEDVENYIDNGDYSGAENSDDVDAAVSDNADTDEVIELPIGMKVTGGYATGLSSAYSFIHSFKCSWTQTVDTSSYVYDVQARCTVSLVSDSGSTVLTGESYSSNWIDYGTNNYAGATSVNYEISSSDLNDKLLESALQNAMVSSGKQLTYKGYIISKLQVRVRNRIKTKCSDWYVCTMDYNSSSTNGTVEDDEGNVTQDDGDISQPDDGNTDSTSAESIESNIAAILNYIRSGFGLLGDNGIISLMSRCYLYLPASIWTMIKFLVAMTVTMAIIGLVKKFVF